MATLGTVNAHSHDFAEPAYDPHLMSTPGAGKRSPSDAGTAVPKQRGSLYYLATQGVHSIRAVRARRAFKKEAPWKSGLRVLCYHSVGEARDQLAVTPSAFRAQMESVLRMDATPVGLDNALDVLDDGGHGRYVCVTFDDGYHDLLDHAVPVLRELQIPSTFFVSSAIIDRTAALYWYERPPAVMSWSEVENISRDKLFTIGAHSRTHPALPTLTDERAWDEIAAQSATSKSRRVSQS